MTILRESLAHSGLGCELNCLLISFEQAARVTGCGRGSGECADLPARAVCRSPWMHIFLMDGVSH